MKNTGPWYLLFVRPLTHACAFGHMPLKDFNLVLINCLAKGMS